MFKTKFLSKIKHTKYFSVFDSKDSRADVLYAMSTQVVKTMATEHRMDVSKRIPVNFIEGHK